MPIVDGDIVAPHLDSATLARTAFGPVIQPQPPKFGIADDVPGDVNVLWWEDGSVVTGIDPSSLDTIDAADANEVDRLQFRVVQINPSNKVASPEYVGVVNQLYVRDPAGAGTSTTPTLALVRTLNGIWYEIQSDQLLVVDGR